MPVTLGATDFGDASMSRAGKVSLETSTLHFKPVSPSPVDEGRVVDDRDNEDEDPELELLGERPNAEGIDEHAAANHTRRTAPVFTGDAMKVLDADVPQRAVYGRVITQHAPGFARVPTSPKLYINSNAPFSALVCGVQGSGKSHTTSVLLESCLIRDKRIGTLPAPLSGLVFHFDTAAGGGHVQPCEAAYLASLDPHRAGSAQAPEVVVLVLPGDLTKMRTVYAGLPGIRVEPLRFASEDISGDRLLAMMKVDENGQMPLYMEAIMSILRSMDTFNYNTFRAKLNEQKFNPGQKSMLNLRLSLLDSCLNGGTSSNRVANYLRPGALTIIDLSSQFMDGSSACGFFDIILGLFVEVDISAGKLVVLDEAHKYLTENGSSSRLTESLLTVIRQQRHLNTRIIISTQEPTVVPPNFLDLCSFIIAHRFSSPKWLNHLGEHVSSAGTSAHELFSKIVNLQTGQAIMFASAGLGVSTAEEGDREDSTAKAGTVAPIGQGYLLVRSRQRITRDGGHSLLAVQDPEQTTRIGRGTSASATAATPPARSQTEFPGSPGYSSDTTRIGSPQPPTTRPSLSSSSHNTPRQNPLVPPAPSTSRQSLSSGARALLEVLRNERTKHGTVRLLWSELGPLLKQRVTYRGTEMRRFIQELQGSGLVKSSAPSGSAWVMLK